MRHRKADIDIDQLGCFLGHWNHFFRLSFAPEVSLNPAESTYTTHSAPPGVPRVKWLMDLVVDFCSCPILKPSRGVSDPYTSFSVPLSADRYRRLVSWRPARIVFNERQESLSGDLSFALPNKSKEQQVPKVHRGEMNST